MKKYALIVIFSLPIFYLFFFEFRPLLNTLIAKKNARSQQELIIDGADPTAILELPAAGNSSQ